MMNEEMPKPSIEELAQQVAHILFAPVDCFAFTGEGPKPHSAQCQRAALIITRLYRDIYGGNKGEPNENRRL